MHLKLKYLFKIIKNVEKNKHAFGVPLIYPRILFNWTHILRSPDIYFKLFPFPEVFFLCFKIYRFFFQL